MKLAGVFPPVFVVDEPIDGRANAQHNFFFIKIWKDAECFHAVLAQERLEFWYLKMWYAIHYAPAATVGTLSGLHGFVDAAIMVLVLGFLIAFFAVRQNDVIRRRMEFLGHLEETKVAAEKYGKDFDTYLAKEARAMAGGSYDQFDGWTADQIEAEMRRIYERQSS